MKDINPLGKGGYELFGGGVPLCTDRKLFPKEEDFEQRDDKGFEEMPQAQDNTIMATIATPSSDSDNESSEEREVYMP